MSNLPGPNDPLVLRDGRKIDVATGRTVRQSSTRPQAPVVSGDSRSTASPARRRIEDLAIEPALLSSLMVVAAFKLCNFDNIDVMNALGTSPEMMMAVENHTKFGEVYDLLVQSVQTAAYGDASNIIMMNAPKAAERLTALLDEDDPVLLMSVADKVLDKAGVGKNSSDAVGSGFRIEVFEKTDDKAAHISIKVGA